MDEMDEVGETAARRARFMAALERLRTDPAEQERIMRIAPKPDPEEDLAEVWRAYLAEVDREVNAISDDEIEDSLAQFLEKYGAEFVEKFGVHDEEEE